MSLLTICQDASDELGIERPTLIVGSSEETARRLYRLVNSVCLDLVARCEWQALRSTVTFVTVPQQLQPNVLNATDRIVPDTAWDRTNYFPLSGIASPIDWEAKTAFPLTAPARWFIRDSGTNLRVYPPPAGGETYALEVFSSAFCQSAAGVPQARWLADTDTGRISEEMITLGLIYRFLTTENLPAGAAGALFESRLAQELSNDMANPRILVAGDIFTGSMRSTGEPTRPKGWFR